MTSTVLLVDDAPDTQALIAAVLKSEGYSVSVAGDGETALARAHEIRPDLVLLDVSMPVMDGLEVCARMKADDRLSASSVIFMTGMTTGEDIVRGFRAGGADYVTKPIKPEALLARLEAHLQRVREQTQADMALSVGGRAALIVDGEGMVQWHSSRAEALLRTYLNTDDLHRLPDTLLRWLGNRERTARPYRILRGESQLSVRLAGPTVSDGWILTLVEHNDVDLIADFAERFALTPRQAEVLVWVSRGKTNPEIGVLLKMKSRTVDKHLEHIFPRLGVETRAAAAAIALDAIG